MHYKAEVPNCSITNTAAKCPLGHMTNLVHFISFFQYHSNYYRALSKDDNEQLSFFLQDLYVMILVIKVTCFLVDCYRSPVDSYIFVHVAF